MYTFIRLYVNKNLSIVNPHEFIIAFCNVKKAKRKPYVNPFVFAWTRFLSICFSAIQANWVATNRKDIHTHIHKVIQHKTLFSYTPLKFILFFSDSFFSHVLFLCLSLLYSLYASFHTNLFANAYWWNTFYIAVPSFNSLYPNCILSLLLCGVFHRNLLLSTSALCPRHF